MMPPPMTPAAVAAPLPDPLPNWFPAKPPAPAPTRVPQPLASSATTLMIAMIRISCLPIDWPLACERSPPPGIPAATMTGSRTTLGAAAKRGKGDCRHANRRRATRARTRAAAGSADGRLGLVGIRHAHADGAIAERVDVAAMAKIGVGAWAPVPQLEIVPPHRPRLVRRRDRVEVDDEEAIADLDEFAEIIVLVDGVVAREPVALLRGGVRELAAAREPDGHEHPRPHRTFFAAGAGRAVHRDVMLAAEHQDLVAAGQLLGNVEPIHGEVPRGDVDVARGAEMERVDLRAFLTDAPVVRHVRSLRTLDRLDHAEIAGAQLRDELGAELDLVASGARLEVAAGHDAREHRLHAIAVAGCVLRARGGRGAEQRRRKTNRQPSAEDTHRHAECSSSKGKRQGEHPMRRLKMG